MQRQRPIFATAQGNYQFLPPGNVSFGHGWIPVMEEFAPSGEMLTTVQFGPAVARPGGGFEGEVEPTLGYRDFKHQWTGCPGARPDVVAEREIGKTRVWVSWNGATEVEGWEVLVGGEREGMECVKRVNKAGFQTEIVIEGARYVRVRPVIGGVRL